MVHVASRRGLSAARRGEQTGAVVCRYDELPGGADAVVVATPPALHRREAERAVEAGAAALVETPLAATLADADALVEPGRARPGGVRREPGPLAGGGRGGGGVPAHRCAHVPRGAPGAGSARLGRGAHRAVVGRGRAVRPRRPRGGARAADGRPGPGDGRGGGDRPPAGASRSTTTPRWCWGSTPACGPRSRHRGGPRLRPGTPRPPAPPERCGWSSCPSRRSRSTAWACASRPPPEVAAPQLHHLGYVAQLEALAADLEAGAARGRPRCWVAWCWRWCAPPTGPPTRASAPRSPTPVPATARRTRSGRGTD